MKIVVSSDRETAVNAEQAKSFFVVPSGVEQGKEKTIYIVCADDYRLSIHKSETKAISELNKLAITLSADNDNLLYYMEDTK